MSPTHFRGSSRELPLRGLKNSEFLVIALESAQQCGWGVRHISDLGFIAFIDRKEEQLYAEIIVRIKGNFATLTILPKDAAAVSIGNYSSILKQFTETFAVQKPLFSAVQLAIQYEHIRQFMVPYHEDELRMGMPAEDGKPKNLLALFVPAPGYTITPLLLVVNLVLFALMVASGGNIMEPSSDMLLNWGANFRPLTLGGQYWRLLTACFLHIGVLHLLLNMYALMYIGFLLEPYLGKARFLAAYLLTGICASLVSLWWHDITVSAGASGAIFGMYGVFLAMLTTKLIEEEERRPLLISIAIFVGYNLLGGLKSGIDNAAHIGGLVSGVAIGYCFIQGLKNPERNRNGYGIIALLTFAVTAASLFVVRQLPNPYGIYEQKMKVFSANEKEAMSVYHLPEHLPPDSLLVLYRDHGLKLWQQNLQLATELQRMKLPGRLQNRTGQLKQYSALKVKAYSVMVEALEQNKRPDTAALRLYNEQINHALEQLNGE